MAKHNKGQHQGAGNAAVAEQGAAESVEQGSTVGAVEQTAPASTNNYFLTYRREHPGDRSSFGVAGNAGIVVFDNGLFVGGVAPREGITLNVELVPIKVDNKTAKVEAAAAKLVERAAKAADKLVASQAKAEEKRVKAEAALAAAKAKVAAAQGSSSKAEGESAQA